MRTHARRPWRDAGVIDRTPHERMVAALLASRFNNQDPACGRPRSERHTRKRANQTIPRIKTASPIEAVSSARTEGPGSAWRASVGVSMI